MLFTLFMIVRTKIIGHYSLLITRYSLLTTRNTNTRYIYRVFIHLTNLRICRRLIRSRFIRTSHVKSQPVTSILLKDTIFLEPTNKHPLFGLCLRLDNDINEALSP